MQKIKYINNDKSQGKQYDFKSIIKMLRSLNLPDYKMEKYIFSCKWNVVLSERGRAKTTTLLLFSLLMFREYVTTSAYLRTVKDMIAPSQLSELFGVINEYNYIEKLFDGKYNHLKYDKRHYYLTKVDELGNEIKECRNNIPVFHVMSIDRWEHYKSTFNDMNCDIILYDEDQSGNVMFYDRTNALRFTLEHGDESVKLKHWFKDWGNAVLPCVTQINQEDI